MTAPTYKLLPSDGRCRLCGSTAQQRHVGQERFLGFGQALFRCGICAGAYLAPGLQPESERRFYEYDYRHLFPMETATTYDETYLEQIAARPIALHRARIVEHRIPAGGTVLEIGCGTGAFLGQLYRLRPDLTLYGSEIDRKIAGCAFDGAPVSWLSPNHYSGQRYDLVVMFHILEHVADPTSLLQSLRDHLKPNGRIVAEVPDSLAAANRSWKAVHPAHLSYFTARSLDRLARRSGLVDCPQLEVAPVPQIGGVLWREWQAAAAAAMLPPASTNEIAMTDRLLPVEQAGMRQHISAWKKRLALAILGPEKLGSILRQRAYRHYRMLHQRPFDGPRPVRLSVLDLQIDPLTMDETVHLARRAMLGGRPLVQADVNVGKLFMMRDDPLLAEAVNQSEIISADGMGILLAARLLGAKLPERVSGIDLMERIMQLCAEEGLRPYLLGARPEIIQAAADRFRARYPALEFAGLHHGYFSTEEAPAIAAGIAASGADCLFVGIASPIKEVFLARFRNQLGVSFAMGVGGAFDVVAGLRRRAPAWAQRIGLEWLFRLAQEPRRLGPRYFFTNLRFLALLAQHIRRR